MEQNIETDAQFDVLILGPMDLNSKSASRTSIVQQSLDALLQEHPFKDLLEKNGARSYKVHRPDDWNEQEIIKGILNHLDIADLVIVDLTPKSGPDGFPSPNVYYELGLLHALGMPVVLLYQKGTVLPFYLLTSRCYEIDAFTVALVVKALRSPLKKFLDPNDSTDFTDNRITQFYEGLPIIDISASVGLATGYYYNFCGRLLKEGSFVSHYPNLIKQVIVIRPDDIFNTYEEDQSKLQQLLKSAGLELKTEKLDPPTGDGKGPIWINHINGIVIDLPRTIYPLKISPRLLSLQERLDKSFYGKSNLDYRQSLLKRTANKLLDKVENVIYYHARKERENFRSNRLHFSKIDDIVALLLKLSN